MPFTVSLSPSHDETASWHDSQGNEIRICRPPDDYEIRIETDDLTVGEWYDLRFLGPKLEYFDADEWTYSYGVSRDDWTLAIETFNRNENEVMRQADEYTKRNGIVGCIVIPDELDESKLKRYRLEWGVENNSCTFKLLEKSPLPIPFSIMWVKHEGDLPDLEYENILSYRRIFLDYEF